MWRFLRRRFDKLRKILGIARDLWELAVGIGFAAIPTAMVGWLSYGKQNPEVAIAICCGTFASTIAIIYFILGIRERTVIYRRLKVQQMNLLHGTKYDKDKLGLTANIRILNRAKLPVQYSVQHVSLILEDRSSKQITDPLPGRLLLDNDHGWITIATITDLPDKPMLKGHLHLDIHYGEEDADEYDYRFEYRSDVIIAVEQDGSTIVTLPNGKTTHTKRPREE